MKLFIAFLLLVFTPSASAQQPITFNTNFEGASIGRIEKLDETTFRAHVEGQHDERGRNRQATWYFFRMDHLAARPITLTLTDFIGEYNDRPGAVAMHPSIRPVYSADAITWRHFADSEMTWDNEKKEATLRFTPQGQTIWIAHIPPYTTEHLRKLIAEVAQHPHALVEVIGRTARGRDLHLLTITDPAATDDRKKVLWLQARQHAWEAGTSWVMEGAVRFALSDDAKWLRERFILKFTPMMDPDGCAEGNVRFNANGYDVNRHWDEVDLRGKDHLRLMPEIWYVKKAIFAQMDSKSPIALMVNMHNTETAEYLESLVAEDPARARLQRLSDLLVSRTTFDPSRGPTFSQGKTTTTNVLWEQKKVPVALMEQRISPGPKLGRPPTTTDRLDFGKSLLHAMADAVEPPPQ